MSEKATKITQYIDEKNALCPLMEFVHFIFILCMIFVLLHLDGQHDHRDVMYFLGVVSVPQSWNPGYQEARKCIKITIVQSHKYNGQWTGHH